MVKLGCICTDWSKQTQVYTACTSELLKTWFCLHLHSQTNRKSFLFLMATVLRDAYELHC